MVIQWSNSILMVIARSRRWVEVGLWTSIWTHQDIPVLSTYTSWYYQWILITNDEWVKNVYILHWNERWVEDEKKFCRTSIWIHHGINVLYIYELVLPIIIAVDLYCRTIKELQLSRRRVMDNTTIYLRYAARELWERVICMSGDYER